MKAVQILSGFDGDERIGHCIRQGLERGGEYWERSGNRTAVQQGRERTRKDNGGWRRKSLGWQVGGDLGSTGDRQTARVPAWLSLPCEGAAEDAKAVVD